MLRTDFARVLLLSKPICSKKLASGSLSLSRAFKRSCKSDPYNQYSLTLSLFPFLPPLRVLFVIKHLLYLSRFLIFKLFSRKCISCMSSMSKVSRIGFYAMFSFIISRLLSPSLTSYSSPSNWSKSMSNLSRSATMIYFSSSCSLLLVLISAIYA